MSWQALTKDAATSGANANSTSVCTFAECPSEIWVDAAIGMPSGSTRQKLSPYARIVSAISCPTVRSAGGSAAGSSGTELLEQLRHDRAQQREPVVETPAGPIWLIHLVDDDPHFDRRNGGELAGPQDCEALHRLDFEAGRSPDSSGRRDRADARARQRATDRREQPGVRLCARRDDRSDCGVRVDRLVADHGLDAREAA